MREERVKVRSARQDFAEVINRVRYRQATVLVTKRGEPVAALISIEELRRLQSLDVYTQSQDAQMKHT